MKSSSLFRSAIYGIRRIIESKATFSSLSLLPQKQLPVLKTTAKNHQVLSRQQQHVVLFKPQQNTAAIPADKSAMLKQIIDEQKKINEIISSITRKLNISHINQRVQKTTPEKVEKTVISFPDACVGEFQVMNRNGRIPRRANGGKRPVCRAGRRNKRRRWGNHKR